MKVTVHELADIFDKTPRTIQLWSDQHGMPKAAHGEYDLKECAAWRNKFLEEKIEMIENNSDEKLIDLKKQEKEISIKHKKLTLMQNLGRLILYKDAKQAWVHEVTIIKKALHAFKFKLNTRLEGITDPDKRLNEITLELNDVLNKIGNLDVNKTWDEEEAELELETIEVEEPEE